MGEAFLEGRVGLRRATTGERVLYLRTLPSLERLGRVRSTLHSNLSKRVSMQDYQLTIPGPLYEKARECKVDIHDVCDKAIRKAIEDELFFRRLHAVEECFTILQTMFKSKPEEKR